LRAEYERRFGAKRARKGAQLVDQILADLPDPPDLSARDFSLTDRRAVSDHIRGQLKRSSKRR
jgi:hypothetical protein